MSLPSSLRSKTKYNKNAISLPQNFLNLEKAILASKWGKMASHFRYNVNKALNMIQRMFYLHPDISPNYIRLGKKKSTKKLGKNNKLFQTAL